MLGTAASFAPLVYLIALSTGVSALPFTKDVVPVQDVARIVHSALTNPRDVNETSQYALGTPFEASRIWSVGLMTYILGGVGVLFLTIAIFVVIYSTARKREYHVASEAPPNPDALTYSPRQMINAYSRHQSTSESRVIDQPHLRSKGSTTTLSSQTSLTATGAPKFTDSPERQGTLQTPAAYTAQSAETDLEVVVRSQSAAVDDYTPAVLTSHSVQHRHNTQLENAQLSNSDPVWYALQGERESSQRAETAPDVITLPVSRRNTLLHGLRGLIQLQCADVQLLGIGLSWDHDEGKNNPGPVHDIQWLNDLFVKHRYVKFRYLIDRGATREAIRQLIETAYRDANPKTYLIIYFTGHGDENNAFQLYDSGSISEVVLNAWIEELRHTTDKHISIYAVFDFCRSGPVKPNTSLTKDFHVIWACSLLQTAMDLDLSVKGVRVVLPRSCFLLAFILGAHDAATNSSLPPWKHFAIRLKELVRVARGGEGYDPKSKTLPWVGCRCAICVGGDFCLKAISAKEQHMFQVISLSTLEENPDFSAVARFVATQFPLHVQRIVTHVSNHHWVMLFNPVRIAANKGSLKPRKPEFLRSKVLYDWSNLYPSHDGANGVEHCVNRPFTVSVLRM